MKHIFKIFTFCLIISFSGIANAQVIAPQPCDTGYWNSLKSRAWLEAEREIMQNQNLIFKGDSVLEYTCFDRFVAHNKEFAAPIFSTEDFLHPALASVVDASTTSYLNANFASAYMDTRGFIYGADPFNRTPFVDFNPGAYACEEMSSIWRAAKCANFVHDPAFNDTDHFYPFSDMAGFDGTPDVDGYNATIAETRIFGVSPACPGVTGTPGSWGAQHNIARNIDIQYPFEVPTGQVFFDVADRLTPGHCQFSVQTGVEIIIAPANSAGQDGVCTAPGCTWNGGGCS